MNESTNLMSVNGHIMDTTKDMRSMSSVVSSSSSSSSSSSVDDRRRRVSNCLEETTIFRIPGTKKPTTNDIDSLESINDIHMSQKRLLPAETLGNTGESCISSATVEMMDSLSGQMMNPKIGVERNTFYNTTQHPALSSSSSRRNIVGGVVDSSIVKKEFINNGGEAGEFGSSDDSVILVSITENSSVPPTNTKSFTEYVQQPPNNAINITVKKEQQLQQQPILLRDERSRSRSVNIKSPDNLDWNNSSNNNSTVKKWTMEGRISPKRSNMRSENTEFVQKQMEFLQRVFHDTDDDKDVDETPTFSCNKHKSLQLESSEQVNMTGGGGHNKERHQHHYHHSKRTSYSRIATANAAAIASTVSTSQELEQLEQMESSDNVADDVSSVIGSNLSISEMDGINIVDTTREFELEANWQPPPKEGADSFCWKCHHSNVQISCSKCIRSYHTTCTRVNLLALDSWSCNECVAIENSIKSPKRTKRSELTIDLLNQLLSFALKRMSYMKEQNNFQFSYEEDPNLLKYLVNPITFEQLERKIQQKVFRSADEFLSETKWFLHNVYLLRKGNGQQLVIAKMIIKMCRQETMEIDTCAECYLNANSRSDWFLEVCSQPHLLLWAKLKGFPYWPAKCMGVNSNSLVNVRFFGEHDRAFVPIKDCYLYSEQAPNSHTGRRSARELADCIKEVNVHIERIRAKIGNFQYASYKRPYDPNNELQQLEMMMPGVQEYMRRQQNAINTKPPLQFKIYKTADNNLSYVQKANTPEKTLQATTGGESSAKQKNNMSEMEKVEKEKEKEERIAEMYENNTLIESSEEQEAPNYEVISKLNSDDSNSSKLSTVILKRKSNQMKNNNSSNNIEQQQQQQPSKKLMMNNDDEEIYNNNEKYVMQSSSSSSSVVQIYNAKRRLLDERRASTMESVGGGGGGGVGGSIPTTNAILDDGDNNHQGELVMNISIPPVRRKLIGPKSISRRGGKRDKLNNLKHSSMNNIKKINRNRRISMPLIMHQKKNSSKVEDDDDEEEEDGEEEDEEEEFEKNDNHQKEKSTPETTHDDSKQTLGVVPFVEIKQEIISDVEHENNNNNDNDNMEVDDMMCDVVLEEEESSINSAALKMDDHHHHPSSMVGNSCQVNDSSLTTISGGGEGGGGGVVMTTTPTTTTTTYIKEEALSEHETMDMSPPINDENETKTIGQKNLMVAIGNCCVVPEQTNNNNNPLLNLMNTGTVHQDDDDDGLLGNYEDDLTITNTQLNSSSKGLAQFSKKSTNGSSKINQRRKTHAVQRRVSKAVAVAAAATQQQLTNFAAISPQNAESLLKGRVVASSDKRHLANTNQKNTTTTTTTMVSIPMDTSLSNDTTITPIHHHGENTVIPSPSPIQMTSNVNSLASSTTSTLTSSATTTILTMGGGSGMCSNISAAAAAPPSNNNMYLTTSSTTTAKDKIPPVMHHPPPPPALTTSSCNYVTVSNPNVLVATTTPINPSTVVNNLPPSVVYNHGNNSLTLSSSTAIINPSSNAPAPAPASSHIMGNAVTGAMASAITDIICRPPPKLTSRPTGVLKSHGAIMPPSQAGPVNRKLVNNAHKLTDFFITTMEDTLSDMAQGDDLHAKLVLLTLELERTKASHAQELAELKKNSDLLLSEMRKSMENEKTRLINEIRQQCEEERLRAIEETKRKQWCAQCGQEANLYCCWNTSYCDYPCQQLHWGRHAMSCAQGRRNSMEEEMGEALLATTTGSTVSTSSSQMGTIKSSISSYSSAAAAAGTPSLQGSLIGAIQQQLPPPPSEHQPLLLHQNNNNSANSDVNKASSVLRAPEVLKLPTNTSIRPIMNPAATMQNNSNNNVAGIIHCNASYGVPRHRYNVTTLPASVSTGSISNLASNSNSTSMVANNVGGGSLSAYAILQQNCSWITTIAPPPTVASSTTPHLGGNNVVMSSPSNVAFIPPISISSTLSAAAAAIQHQLPQPPHQHPTGLKLANGKRQQRNQTTSQKYCC